MNKLLMNAFIFVVGAAVGSAVTWKLIRDKFEKEAEAEIDEMRTYFKNRYAVDENLEELIQVIEDTTEEHKEEQKEEQVPSVKTLYRNYAEKYTSQQLTKPETRLEEEDEETDMVRPYIITPEEFADSDYATETLTYYADGVVEDDYSVVWDADEIDEVLGEDFAEHFGEYERDSVYVRNENKEIDYEILRDERNYSDCH